MPYALGPVGACTSSAHNLALRLWRRADHTMMLQNRSTSGSGYGALSDRDDDDHELGSPLTGKNSYDDVPASPNDDREGHFVSSPRATAGGPSHSRSSSGALSGEGRQSSGGKRHDHNVRSLSYLSTLFCLIPNLLYRRSQSKD